MFNRKYAYWTVAELRLLSQELARTNGVVHISKPSPRMKKLLARHSDQCIRAYACRMINGGAE